MNIPFFSSFLKKETQKPSLLSSLLITKLKLITNASNIYVYENVTIYHHKYSFFIPALILDTSRGLYLCEYKEWTFEELKNSTIQKATGQKSSEETLAFEKAHEIIRQKFKELTHEDGVPIYNYLLMENLTSHDYEHLNSQIKELLPQEKIIFQNTFQDQIIQKLQASSEALSNLPNASSIIGSILIQYTIVDTDMSLHLCNEEQIQFINSSIPNHYTLSAAPATGKTSIILLKSILEKLKNPKLKIIIIKPTVLSCEILKKKLLNTIEHAIVEIDITSIEIITPLELLNKNLSKISKKMSTTELEIDTILMKRKMQMADLIICDDADFLPNEFVAYLKHIQEKASLILVSQNTYNKKYTLKTSYRQKQKLNFLQTIPHAKALQTISKLLETVPSKDILVVSNNLNKEKLDEDLESFIKDEAILLDSSKKLIDQDINNLLLATYDDIHDISAKYVILMDACETDFIKLSYAIELCDKEVYILYADECEIITQLKEKYESN
jgi:hypothetical protein